MKSYEQIAEAMYRAWVKERESREVVLGRYLAWSALSDDGKAAWIAAARQAAAELALVH